MSAGHCFFALERLSSLSGILRSGLKAIRVSLIPGCPGLFCRLRQTGQRNFSGFTPLSGKTKTASHINSAVLLSPSTAFRKVRHPGNFHYTCDVSPQVGTDKEDEGRRVLTNLTCLTLRFTLYCVCAPSARNRAQPSW